MLNVKRFNKLLMVGTVAPILMGCGGSTTDVAPADNAVADAGTPVEQATATFTRTPVPSPSATATESPTTTPTPTQTATPTATATATPRPTAADTPAPAPTETAAASERVSESGLSLDWLIETAELEVLTEPLGIEAWELQSEIVWNYRVCLEYWGASWSIAPNNAINCAFTGDALTGLDHAVASMQSDTFGILPRDAVQMDSEIAAEHDFVIYAWKDGQTFFDAFLLQDGVLFWVGVSVGTNVGFAPE